jgi:hypothetical protein
LENFDETSQPKTDDDFQQMKKNGALGDNSLDLAEEE